MSHPTKNLYVWATEIQDVSGSRNEFTFVQKEENSLVNIEGSGVRFEYYPDKGRAVRVRRLSQDRVNSILFTPVDVFMEKVSESHARKILSIYFSIDTV